MKKFFNAFLHYCLYFVLIFFTASIFFALLYKFVNPPVTPLMIMRCSGQLISGKLIVLKKTWVPIEKISPELGLAIVAAEDNLFFQHNGFDLKAIKKASV